VNQNSFKHVWINTHDLNSGVINLPEYKIEPL
jgi:hypothetical protein